MITKRAHNRRLLLHPCRVTNAIILYVIAVVAQRYGIQLHCLMVMSNHYHACLTDTEGRLPDFTRDCHSTIARALNAEFGGFESLWSAQQTSHVTCAEPSDLVDKIVYSMANPVKARLVAHGKNWPGIRRAWPAKPICVARTGKFFRHANPDRWPENVTFELSRPPGYEELDDEQFAAFIEGEVETRENEIRQEVAQEGETFLGRRKVLQQSRYDRPKSRGQRFEVSPRLACKNQWLRAERLARNRAWREAYQAALKRWRARDRMVEFPPGTYKMRILHNVRCAPPPE